MSAWYADAASRALILRRYVPWLAGLSLVWEMAQLPLYGIWLEASPGYIAFAVAHCTAGDVLIGTACLVAALVLGRERELVRWRWPRLAAMTTALALGYTIFSEWMNTTLYRWSYSDLMPVVAIGGLRLGWSPLAQWLVVVPLSFFFARSRSGRAA